MNLKKPSIIKGGKFSDERGNLLYNNTFNALGVKRVYVMDNNSTSLKRGWQGHKIEQRWIAAIQGSFKVLIKPLQSFETTKGVLDIDIYECILTDESLDYLHIPQYYATCIQSLEEGSKLLLLADYMLGEVKDEWRYNISEEDLNQPTIKI